MQNAEGEGGVKGGRIHNDCKKNARSHLRKKEKKKNSVWQRACQKASEERRKEKEEISPWLRACEMASRRGSAMAEKSFCFSDG